MNGRNAETPRATPGLPPLTASGDPLESLRRSLEELSEPLPATDEGRAPTSGPMQGEPPRRMPMLRDPHVFRMAAWQTMSQSLQDGPDWVSALGPQPDTAPHQPRATPKSAAAEQSAMPPSTYHSLADQLRPLLRQWLDDNMTRVLHNAMRIELEEFPYSG